MKTMDSVERVFKALEEGPLTSKQIQAATGLARRTVYVALGRLRRMGILCEQLSLRDARQTVHWLCR